MSVNEPIIKSRNQQTSGNEKRSLKRICNSVSTLGSMVNIMAPLKKMRATNNSTLDLHKENKFEVIRSCVNRIVKESLENEPKQFCLECDELSRQYTWLQPHPPPKKKVSASKVASIAKGLSPKCAFKRRSSKDEPPIQRASSLRLPKSTSQPVALSRVCSKKYKPVQAPTRRRDSKLWVDTLDNLNADLSEWTPQQIKRQEAIYELYCGEADLVEDLKLLQEVYFHPVAKLKLLNDNELSSIFGSLQALLPLHEDMVRRIEKVRNSDGSVQVIGKILMEWIPSLTPYIPYCANQLRCKENLLEQVKENVQFSDFLQRCLESPFSRKLDLWSFLDSPRSRLVKYPLLFSNIHKYTPKDHPDRPILYRSIKQIESVIREADKETGISNCSFYKNRFYLLDESSDYKAILEEAQTVVCQGTLKTKNGSKVDAFLFNTVFVCSRLATRNGGKCYQVAAKPIPVRELEVTDLCDGELRLGGSFRTTLSKGPTAKHAFRVSTKQLTRGKSIILQANDKHDKKQWMNAFMSVVTKLSSQQSVDSDMDEERISPTSTL